MPESCKEPTSTRSRTMATNRNPMDQITRRGPANKRSFWGLMELLLSLRYVVDPYPLISTFGDEGYGWVS
ncbi:hypothetical protein ACTXT7_005840 [Hymenolepis weldensis]